MSKYWFKAKRYGWGIGFPISWQGWLAVAGYCALIVIAVYIDIVKSKVTLKDGLRFILDILVLATLFILCFKDRVEGGLRWRWGNKD